MVLRFEDNQGIQALDQNQIIEVFSGNSVSNGVDTTINSGTLGQSDTLQVASGDVIVGGSKVSVSQQNVQIDSSDPDNPRKDVVYVDSNGNVQVDKGTPEDPEPEGANRFNLFQPAPPERDNVDGAVVAEIFVGAGVSSISSNDVRDRRLISNLTVDQLTFFDSLDFGDDQNLNFGDAPDFSIRYDSTDDELKVKDEVNDTEKQAWDKSGDTFFRNGAVQVGKDIKTTGNQTIWDSSATEIPDSAMGSIDNATLANSSVTVAGNSVSLGGSTAVSANDLSDVNLSTPSAGQLLIYDGTNSEFDNASLTAGNALSATEADSSLTIDVDSNGIGTNELDESASFDFSSQIDFISGISTEKIANKFPKLDSQRPSQTKNLKFTKGIGSTLFKEGVVLSPSSSGWDSSRVESCFPFYNERTQRFEMFYTGWAGTSSDPEEIGFAVSHDGVNWEKDSNNPVFSPSSSGWDSGSVTGPYLYWEGWEDTDTVYMYYIGTDTAGYENGTKQHGLAKTTWADFPTGWTRYSGNPIIQTGQASWRNDAIWKSSVVKKQNTYYMFFNASPTTGGEQIGYATSTDLETWNVADNNSPVLEPIGSDWESDFVADPWVIRRGDTWLMYYYGNGNGTSQNGVAYTTDEDFPLGWTRLDNNPILKQGLPGRYDDNFAHKPKVIQDNSQLYHYYTSVGSDTNRSVALARTRPEGVSKKDSFSPRNSGNITTTSTTYTDLNFFRTILSADNLGVNGDWSEYELRIKARIRNSTQGETVFVNLGDPSFTDFNSRLPDADTAQTSSDDNNLAKSDWWTIDAENKDDLFVYFQFKVTGGTGYVSVIDLEVRRRSGL